MSPWRARWQRIAPAVRNYGIPALAFLAIVLAMFWRLWTPIHGARRMFQLDAQWEYWGDLQFQYDALRHGHFPLWNPFDRGGYPFHADPQAGVLYPITWLLLGVAALASGVPSWLISVKIVFHFWLAGLGVYAFLRRRGTPVPACYVGGLVLLLTYPYIHNLFSALNWSMAWAGWALCAVDAWAERPTRGRGALVALTLGMGVLAGAMASFWYTLLLVAPYGVWAIVHHAGLAGAARSAARRAYLRAAATTAGIAGALFLGMVAAQLGATAALVSRTVRDTRDLDFVAATAFTPDDMMSFIIPRLPGENCYVGIAVVMWVVAALTMKPDPRKLVLGGVALLGVMCAWGHIAGVLPFSASTIPMFGWFRRAHRYLYVTMVPLAILGAEGLAELAALEADELRKRVGRVVLAAGAIGLVIFGVGFVVKTSSPDKYEAYAVAYALGFAAVAAGAWLTRQIVAKEGGMRRFFFAFAPVLVAFDLMIAQQFKLDQNMIAPPDVSRDKEIAGLTGVPDGEFRMYDLEYLKFRPGLRRQVRDLGGYEGDPLGLSRFAKLLASAKAAPARLGHANVRWFLQAGPKSLKNTGDKAALRPVRNGVFELTRVAPRVMWVDRAVVVDGGEGEALKTLEQHAPGTTAVLERKTLGAAFAGAEQGDAAAPTVAGRVTKSSRDGLTAEIDAPADGVVVIAEAYYPGWTATVDGARAPIVPANVLFRGVPVGPGHHVIAMRYHAPRYLALAPVSLLAVLAAIGLAVWERRRERAAAIATAAAALPAPPTS